jgi:hypothetical protein
MISPDFKIPAGYKLPSKRSPKQQSKIKALAYYIAMKYNLIHILIIHNLYIHDI